MKRLCIFCGSSVGAHPAYAEAARQLGTVAVQRGLGLVYGGGNIGLMAELADAFVALPGGYGTLEEFCEILTWFQLGFHAKPCGLVNVRGFYDAFLAQIDHAVQMRFIRSEHRGLILVESQPEWLLSRLLEFQPPVTHKWIDRDQT